MFAVESITRLFITPTTRKSSKISPNLLDSGTLERMPGLNSDIIPDLPLISMAEVRVHDSCESCWIVFQDRVYDITKFMQEHPGGMEIILEHAGTDATTVFEDVCHSKDARILLLKYCIGKLA